MQRATKKEQGALKYPPEWITVRCPLADTKRPRGAASTAVLPTWINTRMSERDAEFISVECQHLGVTRAVFIRHVAILAARFLYRQRTGDPPPKLDSEF